MLILLEGEKVRASVLLWNIVPWYLGVASRKPKIAELLEGAEATLDLLETVLLDVHTVVVCGRSEPSRRGIRLRSR
ncbi:hypothetical protein GCM10009655_26240 [Rhodoglobus aureus]|uniref:Uncharacterized protein n=1 Tax=Rhodoglobus aureus TaxID=191497 RepID=A0ABP4GQL5_9MICO